LRGISGGSWFQLLTPGPQPGDPDDRLNLDTTMGNGNDSLVYRLLDNVGVENDREVHTKSCHPQA
jgi:hypothetical protein